MIKPFHYLLLALSLSLTGCGNTDTDTNSVDQQTADNANIESADNNSTAPAVEASETEPPESLTTTEPTDEPNPLVDEEEVSPSAESDPLIDDVVLSPPTEADLPVDDAVLPAVAGSDPLDDAALSPSAESDNETAPTNSFNLSLDQASAVLEEGNSEGTTIAIEVAPDDDAIIELAIGVENSSDAEGIEVSLSQQRLDSENPSAEVRFTMPVGMHPQLAQQRTFFVRASTSEETITQLITLDITPVNAPDVYLLIGQSNMVGSSEDGATQLASSGAGAPDSRIRQLNVSGNDKNLYTSISDFSLAEKIAVEPRFVQAQDPLHEPLKEGTDEKDGTRVGSGIAFARAALNDTTQDIYLVPAAWSASGFCDALDGQRAWNAQASDNTALGGTGLLERALARLNLTLQDTGGVFRGILWHQGEADSGRSACADSYAENLALMVERIRVDAAEDARGSTARGPQAPIPFIVGTMSRGQDSRGDYSLWSETKETVDSVHRQVTDLIPYADWVNNDDLVPSAYPCGADFCVHFGSLALGEMGERYYQALERVWNRE